MWVEHLIIPYLTALYYGPSCTGTEALWAAQEEAVRIAAVRMQQSDTLHLNLHVEVVFYNFLIY